jgi:hypothetical protein
MHNAGKSWNKSGKRGKHEDLNSVGVQLDRPTIGLQAHSQLLHIIFAHSKTYKVSNKFLPSSKTYGGLHFYANKLLRFLSF